jgi:hypothetical protein
VFTQKDHAPTPTKKTAILPLGIVSINHGLHGQIPSRYKVADHSRERRFNYLAIPPYFVVDKEVDVFVIARVR